jgi:Flp pilus assembly protein TadG
MKRANKKSRNQRGAYQAEFAAVIVVGLPLLALLVYVGLECAQFYTIKSAMEVGARTAARQLVVNYNNTGSKNTVVNLTSQSFINNSNQFTVNWDPSNNPTYVTVTCSYPSGGGNGLPEFPAGPLRFLLKQNATFNLRNVVVQGSFTLPVQ